MRHAGTTLAGALLLMLIYHETGVAQENVVFPRDPAVIDAKADLGARGDGVADDTDALQRGLDMSCGMNGESTRVLYLPNGTYRVTRTLVVNAAVGPWLYGQSRDGVVIRLDDGVEGCTAVLRTHPRETDPGSADWFMRNIRNLTIDVGDNPGTDGIRYFATNSGIIRNVRVTGHGNIGINSGFMQLSGPNLIQDVEIDGFAKGILSQWIWGQTLSRVKVRNCREVGVEVCANTVAIEDLTVTGTPLALLNTYPEDWTWWGGVVSLVGGVFSGGDPAGPAIRNTSVLYLRDVRVEGFGTALESQTPQGSVNGPTIGEYASHDTQHVFPLPEQSVRLPIKPEPDFPWETDPTRWVCANDYGAVAGDNQDDTAALQAAVDAAAAAGATTVYLRGIGGTDPNWYSLEDQVRLHGSVRHLIGLGFGRILGGEQGAFVVDDAAAPVTKFEQLDAFGGPLVALVARGARQTLMVDSCSVRVVGEGAGDIFMTNCPARIELREPGQSLWARHLNPEGDDDVGLVRNAGARLWIMGMKCEGKGVRVRTSDGGRSEIYGSFIYGPSDLAADDPRPLFDVVNGSMLVAGLREINFGPTTWAVKVREQQGEEVRQIGQDENHGWIGWSLYRSGKQE